MYYCGTPYDATPHGKGKKQRRKQSHRVMKQTRKANLCLNYAKLSIKQSPVKFFDLIDMLNYLF